VLLASSGGIVALVIPVTFPFSFNPMGPLPKASAVHSTSNLSRVWKLRPGWHRISKVAPSRQLMTNNCFLRERVSRLENQIQLHPESVLESLTLNDRDHGMFISFLTQDCCARLRYLKLTHGCWVLAQMLLLERAHPADPAMPITRESPSMSWKHFTPDFVRSRIRCVSTLRSLTLGTHDGGFFLSTHFVNRLLRCLPELQVFVMRDSVSDLKALTAGLGHRRHRHRQVEGQLEAEAGKRDIDDGTWVREEETEEEDDERPLLRSISLRVSTSVDRPREEQLLREKFRFLESVILISIESDPILST